MKILFLALPGAGHYLSTLPLAWAFRAAGHEVLLVNNGPAAQKIADSGLTAVDAAPGRDLWAEFMARATGRFGDTLAMRTGAPLKPPTGMWAPFVESMTEGALRVAESFAPDLIVSTLEQGAGKLVAAALGCPLLEQSVRLAWGALDAHAAAWRQDIEDHLEPTRTRLGIKASLPRPMAYLDLRPPRLGGRETAECWLVQGLPYNGGKVLPPWVVERPSVPRVVVTLGSVVPQLGGLAGLKSLVANLAAHDVEVVLALGDLDLTALGSLPSTVRNAGWMPLSALMPTTTAIIHHGGAATCYTPLFYGVPQLVLPQGADQPMNAKVVVACGAGLQLYPDEAAPEAVGAALRRLIEDPSYRRAAAEIKAEIGALPSPADVVARLVGLF